MAPVPFGARPVTTPTVVAFGTVSPVSNPNVSPADSPVLSPAMPGTADSPAGSPTDGMPSMAPTGKTISQDSSS